MERRSGLTTLFATIATALAIKGCGRASGPEIIPTTTLAGRVLLDGQPIGRFWLEIVPIEGTLGRLRSAPLASDGTFTIQKIPVGRVAIRLAGPPFGRTGNPRLDKFLAEARRMPLIHKTVTDGLGRSLDLDLRAELHEFERLYPDFL